jgi:hypothetical protein
VTFYSDDARHLVCVPYSVEHLHHMAEALGIKRCWYHPSVSSPHYDIPKRRIAEVQGKTVVVPTKTILAICQGKWLGEQENALG